MSVLRTVARPLLACPFVLVGIDAFARPAGHRERAQTFAPLAKKAGMEFDETTADLATRGLGVGFALAGLALATGKCPRVAGGVLAALEVSVALANNPFWRHRGERRRTDLAGLAVSAGLVGGALIAAGDRAGKPSFSWRIAAARRHREALAEARLSARVA